MRKLATILVTLVLALGLLPAVLSNDVGSGVGMTMETEKFVPRVWMCDHRVVLDDKVEPGRIDSHFLCIHDGNYFRDHQDECSQQLIERVENYAFEGEQISWLVLVMDKNGVEKIKDVYVSVGTDQGTGSDIQANCKLVTDPVCDRHEGCDRCRESEILDSCNARIDEEKLDDFNPSVMEYFDCTLTVETPAGMKGENWVTVNAEDLDGNIGMMDENEFWFFNPDIALTIGGALDFGTVRPGTVSYSDTITVGNDAEMGSGVLLDMYIAGTDFYDPMSSGAKCPTTNQLSLDRFKYFATNGAYSTLNVDTSRRHDCYDSEGYSYIPHGDKISQAKEIIGCESYHRGFYDAGNVLTPGAEISMTFKLSLPEPCNGDFSDGQISFWGEAV